MSTSDASDKPLRAGRGQHARAELDELPGDARSGWLLAAPAAPRPLRAFGAMIDWAVVLIGGTMVLLVFANVVMRVLEKDAAFVVELGELLMVWVTFLGGAAAARRNAHMRITEFVDKLAEPTRRWADTAIQCVCLAMLAVLIAYGVSLTNASWGNVLTVLGIPMAWQYMALPLGCGAMAVFIGWDVWQILHGVPRARRYKAV